jgi:hypothetical protein
MIKLTEALIDEMRAALTADVVRDGYTSTTSRHKLIALGRVSAGDEIGGSDSLVSVLTYFAITVEP